MSTQTIAPRRIPGIGELKLPVTRNDLLLLMVAFMEIGLGVETYLAHLISGEVKPAESIPVFFGPLAGLILLIAVFIRLRRRALTQASLIIIGVAIASVVVGVVGSAFHWARIVPPAGFADRGLRWDWIIFAPPVAGPLSFAGVGLLAILAVLEDTKPETGRLTLPGIITFNTPLPQTRQFLWLIAFGLYAATLSSFLDHGRTSFENIMVWIPVVLGLFGSIATTLMALYAQRTRSDWFIFFWVMIAMIGMGVLGLGLHINADLPEGTSNIVIERFIRGAPVMAPLLFALMGTFGLITMVDADTELPSATETT
jgi:hypothetical protein